jgi:hypothetical protein
MKHKQTKLRGYDAFVRLPKASLSENGPKDRLYRKGHRWEHKGFFSSLQALAAAVPNCGKARPRFDRPRVRRS